MIRNTIWYEMDHIKTGEIYLSKYISFQHTIKRGSKVLTLAISVSGILGWKYFENYAWFAFLLIAILQILSLVENAIIRSDKEIEELAKLKTLYTKYFNLVEKLWQDYEFRNVDDNSALEKFHEYRSIEWLDIEKIDSSLNIKRYNFLLKPSEKESAKYLKNYHY